MNTDTKIKLVLAIGGGLVAVYLAKKAGGAAASAVNAVNPFNNDNVINRGFTSVYQTVTGSEGTLGTDIYDITHPPGTENTNVINGAATTIYRKITGSTGTIGTDLYDFFNPPKPVEPPIDYSVMDARDAMIKRAGYTSPTKAYLPPPSDHVYYD